MKEYIINKISSILNIEKKHISYDSREVLESKCTYLIHIMVTISKDKFEELSRISEVKDFYFPNGAIFKNCVFNKDNFNIFAPCENLLEFIKCEFDGIDGKNLCNSAKYEECSFKNINDFLNFINLGNNNFIKCVYESDFIYAIHRDKDKDKFLPKMEIKNWTFKGKVDCKNIEFKKEVSFTNVEFKNSVNFSKSTFEKKASFKNCTFNKLNENSYFDFSEITFKDNVYFDDSYFNEFVAFHLCVFEKTASFYSTKFNVIPNFSPGDFKGILNINNATWGEYGNLEFEAVRSIVKDELETIRNIKDSFRAIKNVLIQKNDQLEAQKFHKAELYCRELELEKENKNFSTFIDSLLLKFYRNTSDHHTNFLKILNFTVFCIAVYAVCSFVFVDIYTATFFGESRFISKNISGYVFSGLTLVLICLTTIVIGYNLIHYKYTRKSLICIILFVIFILVTPVIKLYYPNYARWLLLILVIILLLLSLYFYNNEHKVIILFTFLFFCFSTIPSLSSIVYFFADKDKNYDLLFKITIPAMISIYFCLAIFFSYLLEEKYLRKRKYKNLILLVFKSLVWGIVAFVLYLQPQLINPFVGVFKSDEILSKNYFEKKLNDLNASEIMKISNLLKNDTDLNVTAIHKEIIDLNTITNTEIINAKELIKQRIGDISIDDNVSNNTVTRLKEAKDLQEYLVNGIKSSSLVYSIILLLCLYSLTKTARKNSIVPI